MDRAKVHGILNTKSQIPREERLHSEFKAHVDILAAVERATTHFKLCPNRVWAVARSLPGRELNLPLLVPPAELHKPWRPTEDHSLCTFDFCEYSRRDFTSVPQRHEATWCRKDKPRCGPENGFHQDKVAHAAREGRSTVWALDGQEVLARPLPYMAISHVWSDGTGVGVWSQGQVNSCLFRFFKNIAELHQCEGLWWDTICIPKEKAARSKAIAMMHENYEDARVTLVHDCFLRDWEWTDAETACFAIVMSPWFSRGWTSLELARSRKVKIIFKGHRDEPLIKDLDEDILGKVADTSDRPQVAARAIVNLRSKGITKVDDLLTVLGPRYTSWPRDIAVIAGLLTGVDITSTSLQDIYQRILLKIGKISHANVFHNSATMSKGGFTWCSTSLLDLPLASSDADKATVSILRVEQDGSISGPWEVLESSQIAESKFIWNDTHPLIRLKLQLALLNPAKHVLLVEPQTKIINRALLVKVMKKKDDMREVPCQFVGSVYFTGWHKDAHDHEPRDTLLLDFRIGDSSKCDELDIEGGISSQLKAWGEEITASPHPQQREAYRLDAIGSPLQKEQSLVSNGSGNEEPERQLWNAADTGDKETVKRLLELEVNAEFADASGQTALHRAVWRCHVEIVYLLLRSGLVYKTTKDILGQQAIHLAAERGNPELVGLLLPELTSHETQDSGKAEASASNPDYYPYCLCNKSQTALHRAAWSGSTAVVGLFLRRADSKQIINAQDYQGKTPLHFAAEKGHLHVIVQLLQAGADPRLRDSMKEFNLTPMQWAVRNGHLEAAELMADDSDLNFKDLHGSTALHVAARKGYLSLVESILQKRALPTIPWERRVASVLLAIKFVKRLRANVRPNSSVFKADTGEIVSNMLNFGVDVDIQEESGRSAMSLAAENGHEDIVRMLLNRGAKIDQRDSTGRTPLSWAAEGGHPRIVKLFLDTSQVDPNSAGVDGGTPLYWAAWKGHEEVVRLLLQTDSVAVDPVDSLQAHTPLSRAVSCGHESIVKLLLDTGKVDVNFKFPQRLSTKQLWNRYALGESGPPLSLAARGGHVGIARLLLDTGKVDINSTDWCSWTPLMHAARFGNETMVKLLLDHGADIRYRDRSGTVNLTNEPLKGWMPHPPCGPSVWLQDYGNSRVIPSEDHGITVLHLALYSRKEAVGKLMLAQPGIKDIINVRSASDLPLLLYALRIEAPFSLLLNIIEMPGVDLSDSVTIAVTALLREKLGRTSSSYPDRELFSILIKKGVAIALS